MTDLAEDWIIAEPHIAAALREGRELHEPSDILARIEAGEVRLFVGEASALACLIDRQPLGSVLWQWLAGGDFNELVTVLRPAAERWGLAEGCDRTMILGRAGWSRALSSHGYAETARLLEKAL